jgi:hypothetical protein
MSKTIRLLVFCCLAMVACGRADQRSGLRAAVALKQRSMAIESAARIRDAFNTGVCRAIYDDADPSFRALESPEVWLRQCAEIRTGLGDWLDYQIERPSGKLAIGPIVTLDGNAVFSQRSIRVHSLWSVNQASARLLLLMITDGGKNRWIPEIRPHMARIPHMDPPPKRDWEPA